MTIDAVLVGYLALTFLTMVVLTVLCLVSNRKVKFDDFVTIITASPFWPVVILIVIMCVVDYHRNAKKVKEVDKDGNSC